MNDLLIQVLYIVVTGCATALTGLLCAYINKKTKEITENKYVIGAIDAVTTSVSSVTQTYVDAIKKDGKFTKNAQDKAKQKAKEIAIGLITIDGRKAVESLYGDFEAWIEHEIERQVKEQK